MRNLTPPLLITILLLAASGCASFVNIPAEKGDTAINAVNLPPVPGLMGDALAYAVNQYPAQGALALALPAPAKQRTFDIAMKKVGAGSAPWSGPNDDRATYRVLSVHVRGSAAVVEVHLPDQLDLLDNKYLLEINLVGRFSGWSVRGVKRLVPTANQLDLAAPPVGLPLGSGNPGSSAEVRPADSTNYAKPSSNSASTETHDPNLDQSSDSVREITEDGALRPIRSVPPKKDDR